MTNLKIFIADTISSIGSSETEKLDIIQVMMPNNSFCPLNNKAARETEFQGRGTNYSLYFKLTLRAVPHLSEEVEQGTK